MKLFQMNYCNKVSKKMLLFAFHFLMSFTILLHNSAVGDGDKRCQHHNLLYLPDEDISFVYTF